VTAQLRPFAWHLPEHTALKLFQHAMHYSAVMSLAQTLDYIKVAQRRHPAGRTLNQLTLKLIECKVVAYLSTWLS